jgi:hypothetical protein
MSWNMKLILNLQIDISFNIWLPKLAGTAFYCSTFVLVLTSILDEVFLGSSQF